MTTEPPERSRASLHRRRHGTLVLRQHQSKRSKLVLGDAILNKMLPAINMRGNFIGPPGCTIVPLTLHELRTFEGRLIWGGFVHDFYLRGIWSSDMCLVCVADVFPHGRFLTLSTSMAFIPLIFMKTGSARVPDVRQDEQM